MIKRKEFQQRKLTGACVTEAETNANDKAELKERKGKKVFPPTAMIWTTIQRAQMSDIFFDATGAYPEEEENELQEELELEESAEDHKREMREMMEVSIGARSRKLQGQQLTEQQIGLLSTEQKASIEKLRGRALEHGEKPTFHISVDFDVTRA